jgi:VIT1/CCC1 family predicted Fe2+/Mn2+ transporter
VSALVFAAIFVVCCILGLITGPPEFRRFLLTGMAAIAAVVGFVLVVEVW